MNRASSATGWARNPDGTLGWTWNPITGCKNHTPEGLCLGGNFPCYAYKLANGRLKQRYLANRNVAPYAGELDYEKHKTDPFYPRFWEDRLDDPFLADRNICIKRHTRGQRGIPKGIFVCDMGELFGDWIPRKWQEEIFFEIIFNPQHRFYLLTKQPQNLIKWSPFPDNCWVGVTITDGDGDRTPLAYMKKVEAKVKFISFEPLLNWWDVATSEMVNRSFKIAGINWVIIGAQTKPYKPPLKIWVDEITEACKKASIPYFLKDNLRPMMGNDLIQDIPKGVKK